MSEFFPGRHALISGHRATARPDCAGCLPVGGTLVGFLLARLTEATILDKWAAAVQATILRHAPNDDPTRYSQGGPDCEECSAAATSWRDGIEWPCPTLRGIGVVWADHPDYDDGWRP